MLPSDPIVVAWAFQRATGRSRSLSRLGLGLYGKIFENLVYNIVVIIFTFFFRVVHILWNVLVFFDWRWRRGREFAIQPSAHGSQGQRELDRYAADRGTTTSIVNNNVEYNFSFFRFTRLIIIWKFCLLLSVTFETRFYVVSAILTVHASRPSRHILGRFLF